MLRIAVGLLALCVAGCESASTGDPEDNEGTTGSSSAMTTRPPSGPDGGESGSESGPGTNPSTTNNPTTVDPSDSTTEPTGTDEGDTEPPEQTGMELYFGTCLPCHGADATGTPFGYQVRQPVREYATWVIRNGRPGIEFPAGAMDAYDEDQFSDEDLEKMFDFIDGFPRPPDPMGLYIELCSNCHGEDMAGGMTGVPVLGTDFATNMMFVRDGADLGNYGSRETYMPAYDEATLNDGELMLIVGLFNQ